TGEIQPENLPDFQIEARLRKNPSLTIPSDQSLDELMANYEREVVLTMLERNHFSLTKTADQLKLSRHALRYRMQRLNITTDTPLEDDTELPSGKELSRC
ncbi:MAG: helix-turn-helix domain-containing protein, partial [Verrucomicrobia bacterium]|nr:helix-turn-helix domain-containing protein [Verrucomicrobiota bacterium]